MVNGKEDYYQPKLSNVYGVEQHPQLRPSAGGVAENAFLTPLTYGDGLSA
jgi:hypothetical protein